MENGLGSLPEIIIVRGIAEPILFVMRLPIIECRDGHREVTYVAFTQEGTRSRTARTIRGGSWDWLRVYETGAPQEWRSVTSYDGETPEQARAWHARENGMVPVPYVIG